MKYIPNGQVRGYCGKEKLHETILVLYHERNQSQKEPIVIWVTLDKIIKDFPSISVC